MKISAVHVEHTVDSVGYVFDFDGIKVYISGNTKNNHKLNKVAFFYPDIALIYASRMYGDGL